MKEVVVSAICGACGTKLSNGSNVCQSCGQSYPYDASISCKICYLPVYYFTFPNTGRTLTFCSHPDCAGWNIFHSGNLTYLTHEKDVKFILSSRPKRLLGVVGNKQIEIPEDYKVVHDFVKRIILRHPCVDNKHRFK